MLQSEASVIRRLFFSQGSTLECKLPVIFNELAVENLIV